VGNYFSGVPYRQFDTTGIINSLHEGLDNTCRTTHRETGPDDWSLWLAGQKLFVDELADFAAINCQQLVPNLSELQQPEIAPKTRIFSKTVENVSAETQTWRISKPFSSPANEWQPLLLLQMQHR